MRDYAASTISRPMFLVLMAISAVVVLAAGCGDDEPADPLTPQAAARASDPAAPSGTTSAAVAPKTPRPTNTPLPPRTAAEPPTPVAPAVTPTAAAGSVQPRPRPKVPGVELHDSQVVTSVGSGNAPPPPWRDGGGNRLFSTHVFGTPFMLNERGEAVPWIATAITSNDRMTVWTMKLREDAVFQDGTPITAADFKAYWEHGAKPENIAAWGGASFTLGDILGWQELTNGYTAEAEGLRVVDDHTLEITLWTAVTTPTWPLYMAAWHVGISKLEQVLDDDNWGNAPIGAGPFSLAYDPDSDLTVLTRTDLVGGHWNGPHDTPIVEKLVLPNIEDERARLVMFDNGELDLMRLDTESHQESLGLFFLPLPHVVRTTGTQGAALDPNHPQLYVSPYHGLDFIHMHYLDGPLRDLGVRKALAHGVDMEGVVSAIWGPTATHAKDMMSGAMPCQDQNADHQPYDPDLARQHLSDSTYGSGADLPLLMIDLERPDMLTMGVAVKEYWKDNLGVELDILKLESGVARREWPQLSRIGWSSWIPDPVQIVRELTKGPSITYGSSIDPLVAALVEYVLFLPMDHPDRCASFQAVQREYLERAYMIPIRDVDGGRWLVQPWLRGFESTFNLDFNTLTTAYVARH